MAARRLIADIGGTNARFALADGSGHVAGLSVLPVSGHASFDAALEAYLDASGEATVSSAAIAAAGPRDGDVLRLTNAPWRIEADALSRRLGGAPVRLFNDLEAVALGLQMMGSDDVETLVAAPTPSMPAPHLAANVGTGFGAAVAVPVGAGRWVALATEAGHMSLAPVDAAEAALLGGVEYAEQALSGGGYARIFASGARREGNAADEARQTYSRVFGRFIGDLVLATGSWGGVCLCGGVMTDPRRVLDLPSFTEAFRSKGKMAERMSRVRVSRITLDAPALRYLASPHVF